MKNIYLYCLILLSACVEAFDPEVDQAGSQPIIVDALLTDELKRHTVNITMAVDINNNSQFRPITDALVYVEDSNSTIFEFSHSKDGIYQSVNTFSGLEGSSYKLVIVINEEQYESSFETLNPPGKITGLSTTSGFESIQSETGEITNINQVNILADLSFPANTESYYRFDWNATYEVKSPMQGSEACWLDRGQEPPSNLDSDRICYVRESSSSFLRLISSERLEGNSIDSVKIFSVTPNRRFQLKYSPELTMYSITQNAYNFWVEIENQTTNTGGLFDSPPSPINGNINNIDQSGSRVIGIFEVASVHRFREFFLASAAGRILSNYDDDCPPAPDQFGTRAPSPFYCCDCLLLPGSKDLKPDFWED